MKYLYKISFGLLFLVFLTYLLFPDSYFPDPPPDAVQSMEDGDTETPLRRAYFTNFSRQEVISHYQEQLKFLPTLRLNYPPEEAQTLIRDQTRSVYLEELVHPFRESVFINGFIPKEAKDEIWYKGQHFEAKITVRFAPSSIFSRLGFATMVAVSLSGIFFLSKYLVADVRKLTKI